MNRTITQFSVAIITVAIIGFCLVSCGNDGDDNIDSGYTNNEEENDGSTYDLITINKLKGTSWKWVRNEYYKDGVYNRSYDGDNSIITFSDEQVKSEEYNLYANGIKKGTWEAWSYTEGKPTIMMNWQSGEDRAKYGGIGIIFSLSANELDLGNTSSHHCFVSAGNSSGGENTQSGKAPNFIDFSYTYTSSSVTVIFHTDTDITSGTVYYGKNSASIAVSSSYTTIGRHMVQTTIRNLNKSTKYYVKCTVKNSYGTTTSDVLTVMTGN